VALESRILFCIKQALFKDALCGLCLDFHEAGIDLDAGAGSRPRSAQRGHFAYRSPAIVDARRGSSAPLTKSKSSTRQNLPSRSSHRRCTVMPS
jgi:4'-phosphopantetheinyl transferase EntD